MGIQASRMSALYRRHNVGALKYAFLLTGDIAAAEDLVQEAFLRMFRQLRDLRNPEVFGTYLRATITNLARDRYRKKMLEFRVLQKPFQRIDRQSQMPDIEEQDHIRQVLSKLPRRQRAAIILRYYEDMNDYEMADVLGCSVPAAKSLLQRGIAALRKAYVGGNDGS